MDREAWRAAIHGVAKSQTWLSNWTELNWTELTVLIITVYLFFSSSRSLVNISCILSIFASILFLRSWIIFPIIILNYFSGSLPIYIYFIVFFIWGFILFLHLGQNLISFHFGYLYVIVVYILEAVELYFLLFLSAIFWMMIEACASFPVGATGCEETGPCFGGQDSAQ